MLSETELMIADGVQRNGWFVVNYAPTPGSDDPEEAFSYTVGLNQTASWPELITFGLDSERAFSLFADLIGGCWEKKQPPVPHMTVSGLLKGMPVKLVEFAGTAPRYFHYADWFARHTSSRKPRRLQLLWPDRDGKLPDDPACDPEVRAKQRMAGA